MRAKTKSSKPTVERDSAYHYDAKYIQSARRNIYGQQGSKNIYKSAYVDTNARNSATSSNDCEQIIDNAGFRLPAGRMCERVPRTISSLWEAGTGWQSLHLAQEETGRAEYLVVQAADHR